MVAATKQHEIIERRFTAMCPVNDVVGVDVLAVRASRVAATAVAVAQRAFDGRRDYAGAAADRQRFAIQALGDREQARIAGDPLCRGGAQAGARGVQLGAGFAGALCR